MSLYENICSPELLGNSALCQRNASSQESKTQQDRSSLSSLQRKSISVFLTLRDWCPFEKGNLHAFIECLNLAHPKAVFWGLIRERDGVSSLSFKGSRWISTQHRVKAGKSLPWDVTGDESCGFILSLGKADFPFSSLCLNFLSCLLFFSLPRAGSALLPPTQQNTRSMEGSAGHLHGVRWDFQRFMVMKIHLSSKDAAKILGQVGVFRQRIRKKSHLDHHVGWSWKRNLRELSVLCCLGLPLWSKQSCSCQIKVIFLQWTPCERFPENRSGYWFAQAALGCRQQWCAHSQVSCRIPGFASSTSFPHVKSASKWRLQRPGDSKQDKAPAASMGEGGSAPNDSIMFAWLSWR